VRSIDMRNRNIAAALAAATIFSTTIAHTIAQAQSERQAPVSPSTRSDCTPANPAPSPNETTGSAPLGERLSQSKGVICPPAGVDPGITVPPLGGGRMPVIPPPGTPGGDPGIVPK
jgi:hypothetical protein